MTSSSMGVPSERRSEMSHAEFLERFYHSEASTRHSIDRVVGTRSSAGEKLQKNMMRIRLNSLAAMGLADEDHRTLLREANLVGAVGIDVRRIQLPEVGALFHGAAVVVAVPSVARVAGLAYQASVAVKNPKLVGHHFAGLRNHHAKQIVGVVAVGGEGVGRKNAAYFGRIGTGLTKNGGRNGQQQNNENTAHNKNKYIRII